MGAWSVGSFDNDDAMDWAMLLDEVEDLSIVEAALARADVPESEYLEAPTACEAIAAADVLARLLGNWGERSEATWAIDTWVEHVKLRPQKQLTQLAQRVLARVLGPNSELLELWEESDSSVAWRQSVSAVQQRLRTTPQHGAADA